LNRSKSSESAIPPLKFAGKRIFVSLADEGAWKHSQPLTKRSEGVEKF
jgi:hypothetical protein